MKIGIKTKLIAVWFGSIVWWMFIGKDFEQGPSWDFMLAFGVFGVTSFALMLLLATRFIPWLVSFILRVVNFMVWAIGYFIGQNK